jgi:peptidoglycan/LPS O-acetylase OafA/YrhL
VASSRATDVKTEPTTPETADQPRFAHLRALDGLRGVAVLGVVAYHFAPGSAPGGFLGVDVFFVLSGFLITSLLVNEWERSRGISFVKFWGRRARRLLPALFLVLGAVGVYALLMSNQADAHHIGEDGLATLGYFANWHFISSGQSYVERIVQGSPSPLRHTWSLAIEEQFYLVWPIVVGLVGVIVARTLRRSERGRRRFRRVLVALCVVLAVASFVRMITLFHATGDANRVYYGTDSRAFLILIGSALGALSAGVLTVQWRMLRLALVAGGTVAAVVLAVTMAKLLVTDTRLYDGGYGVIAILITLVLVAAAQPGMNPLGRLLETRPIVGLGLISYGVYLWHWPITVWVTTQRVHLDGVALFAVRSLITLSLSVASYVLVEQPIRQRRLLRWTGLRTAFVPVVVVVALFGLMLAPVLAFPSVNAVPRVAPSTASGTVTSAYDNVPRCDRSARVLKKLPRGHRPRIELFGNSLAIESRDCLAQLVRARGGIFESVVHSGVAPCHLIARLRAQVDNPATRPDIAIFSAGIVRTELSCDPVDQFWLVQVREALDIWKAAGTHIYLVPPVPNVPGSAPPLPTNGQPAYVPAQRPEFEAFAANDPAHITVVDAGTFIRDAQGVLQWRMPCLPGGEPGCARDHTIGVRWVDGYHFCTDPNWNGHFCQRNDRGGERRVGTAIALQIVELSLSSAVKTPTTTSTTTTTTK